MPGRDEHHRRGQRGAVVHKLGTLIVALVLVSAVGAYVGLIPTLGSSSSSHHALAEPPASAPGLQLARPPTAKPVLRPVEAAGALSAAKVGKRLSSLVSRPALGKHVGVAVAELGSDTMLWQVGTPPAFTPASMMKLLTTTTALQTMGPGKRFTTSVVASKGSRRIVLVGGGDPLLAVETPSPKEARSLYPDPASLQHLAAQTARSLKKHGVRRVRLGYDASLFTGPAVNPHWEPNYVPESVVSPISALWVNEGREVAGLAKRVPDPARFAATQFAQQLHKHGIDVKGEPTARQAAPGAHRVAAVHSPPLAQIVQHILEVSDNEGAEVLLRQSALATGRPGSATAGVEAVRATLADLGVELRGARIYDGSGLSRHDRLPIRSLVQVLQTAADPAHPKLRRVVASLPVAGFTGSLGYRFVDDAPRGVGVVRAKTGTLTGVHALAGFVATRDQHALVFVAVGDQVPVPKTLDARADLDTIATALATCGCSQ